MLLSMGHLECLFGEMEVGFMKRTIELDISAVEVLL